MPFAKGDTPWNKGKKGLQVSWNKGKKMPYKSRPSIRGKPTWCKGKKLPYVSEFNRLTKTGITLSQEHKMKISQSLKGEKNPNWRGGKRMHDKGYIEIKVFDHPFAMKSGYIFEHRLVMEKHLRKHNPNHPALVEIKGIKYLQRKWVVHHNGTKYPMGSFKDKGDNRIENLLLFANDFEHQRFHYLNNLPSPYNLLRKGHGKAKVVPE